MLRRETLDSGTSKRTRAEDWGIRKILSRLVVDTADNSYQMHPSRPRKLFQAELRSLTEIFPVDASLELIPACASLEHGSLKHMFL